MMQYHPPDSATIGTTQGICPEGWHIPTNKEWLALVTYIGGEQVAGGKLKETGLSHWLAPNSGATNEYGFSALPAGMIGGLGGIPRVIIFSDLGHLATFYTSSIRPQSPYPADWEFYSDSEEGFNLWWHPACGVSVRCVKD